MLARKLGLLLAFSAIWAPGLARAGSIGFSLTNAPNPSGDRIVTVVDSETGNPVAGAAVTIAPVSATPATPATAPAGTAPAPLITDDQGQVRAPDAGDQPQMVSITHDGYASLTVLGVRTPRMVAELKALPQQAFPVASGLLEGFASRHHLSLRGGDLNAGLVMPALSAEDIVSFNISDFVSPFDDTIDVNGPRKIPTNVVLPDQDVGFLFWNFHFDKPGYRLPVAPGRSMLLTGVQTEASAFDIITVGGHHGSSGYAMLNKLGFKMMGTAPVNRPTADFESDIFLTNALAPKYEVLVSAPRSRRT